MLAGQYTNYLWRQVEKYRKGIRIHDEDEPDDELLLEFSDNELGDIFAYLSIVDD
jgi:cytochrome c553